jgi:hypothetical protein
MTIKKAQLEMFPVRIFAALAFGQLAREAIRLGGDRVPVGIKWEPDEIEAYLKLPDPPTTGGPDFIRLVPSDFDGVSTKKTVLSLESLFLAPYAHLGCRQLSRRAGLKDDSEGRRILQRCDRIKGLLRRAGLDPKRLETSKDDEQE